ncbi:hypothetical protein L228DRAFT_245517 [Xylona heveae TC161]|uniref:Mitochondrial nucleoid factor 1 n=1 Tax=Xylona heveae (strain CBS 132557 / TC161) TaxID=1328760 RepID=A0A165I8U1_XYLHT|nr:hypothetical protein L228DRAFT_245517 [Xylona heveae TC161]KZF24553.1 hypothetical protein L228DRAFT_245517 [Xylona heveae TC161]
MSNPIAYRHYLRILRRWPKDLLRPEVTFQNAMRKRLEQRFGPSAVAANPQDKAAEKSITPSQLNETAELAQVNALYSLLENRYSKKYPTSPSLMRPASNPGYYEDLIAELEAAPKRSWLASYLNKWKGFLRFK